MQITPDRHAYHAGDTVRLRIRFAFGGAAAGEATTEQPERRGMVGVAAFAGVEQGEGERTDEETPPPIAPIPRHHPHARKVSIAQVPTPTSNSETPSRPPSLGTIPERGSPLVDSPLPLPSSTEPTTYPRPTKPNQKQREITVSFATIQPHATFTPSPAYIPPEPLLPLRNLLLHQPIGSGSLAPPSATAHLALIDRAAGSDGLTGSLTSLAKGLFGEAEAGTWQDRRREVWLGRGLAVWMGGREVVAVDLRVAEGEAVECECSTWRSRRERILSSKGVHQSWPDLEELFGCAIISQATISGVTNLQLTPIPTAQIYTK